MTSSLQRILVAGVSVRSLARSAIAAGYEVITADGYGDRDLLEPPPAPLRHLTVSPFDPDAVAARVTLGYDAVAWTSSFENHPGALDRLAAGHRMLGNPAAVVRDVRRAERVQQVLEEAGLPTAPVFAAAADVTDWPGGRGFLAKPRRSGGGQGVRHWRPEEPVGEGELLQEWVDGVPGSLIFAADGTGIVVLGVTRQLIGDSAFGATGHRWCGNLLAGAQAPVLPAQAAVLASAAAAARVLTRAFGLRGINGIDFIARDGAAVVIEVNPRWTAAVELAERSLGISLFPAHVSGSEGVLDGASPPASPRVVGKAVVFARSDFAAPDTASWLADPDVRDIPHAGSVVPRGAPICTVFASAVSADACHAALADHAGALVGACAS